jgi:hypothetical protein
MMITNLETHPRHSSFPDKLPRFIAIEAVAFLTSVFLIIALLAVFAAVAPAEPVSPGEDDMGGGIMVLMYALVSLELSIPLAVFLHIHVFKKLSSKSSRYICHILSILVVLAILGCFFARYLYLYS